MQSTPEAIRVIFMKIAVAHSQSKIIFKIQSVSSLLLGILRNVWKQLFYRTKLGD